ncbi:hypothetical protein B0O99DRAFT_689861 [Bisporella sp. PMI_857]|nr:hypothetical protein B0O99DRAFT_689861 [Bisporella sp. PMI_857]
MPSKKLTPEKLMQHLENHDIQFEGPIPPRKWPDRYAPLFQVIRKIWAIRYDEYIKRTDIEQKTVHRQRRRVRAIISKTAKFRRNIGSLEETWRDSAEKIVAEVFDEEAICCNCGNEVREAEYKAYPFYKKEKEALELKYDQRRPCTCLYPNQSVIRVDDDGDDEQGEAIFQSAIGHEVSHDPEDNLDSSRIPMKPDRVFGLSSTAKVRSVVDGCLMTLVHRPIKSDDMLYPFLVIEAKREINAPGFRAIEAQTAFPIRRFLRIQEDLRVSCERKLDPLVWFFAYRGDEWRLYAAINDGGTSRIFHLWLGIVESEDGALQLLQIADFIWTWARNVYRPQIRRCLASLPNFYERSPTLENRNILSPPERPRSPSQSPESEFLTSVIEENSGEIAEYEPIEEAEEYDHLGLQDASSHSFLRWALCRDLSKSWALNSSIRHSDIIMFSFRVFEVPDTGANLTGLGSLFGDNQSAQATILDLRDLAKGNPPAFVLKRGDIPQIEKSWTGTRGRSSYEPSIKNYDEGVRALFFFRSSCQPNDWQLKREMYCILWSPAAAETFRNRFYTNVELNFGESGFQLTTVAEIMKSFQKLRCLSGKHSVACALQCTSLILQPPQDLFQDAEGFHWCTPLEGGIPIPVITRLSSLFNLPPGGMVQLRQYQSNSLLQVLPDEQIYFNPLRALQVGNNFGQIEAIMAIKPDFWPNECPRFCLFIFVDHDFDNEGRLRILLHDTIRARKFLAVRGHNVQDKPSWSADDEKTLQDWRDYFSEENMLKG